MKLSRTQIEVLKALNIGGTMMRLADGEDKWSVTLWGKYQGEKNVRHATVEALIRAGYVETWQTEGKLKMGVVKADWCRITEAGREALDRLEQN